MLLNGAWLWKPIWSPAKVKPSILLCTLISISLNYKAVLSNQSLVDALSVL